MGYESLINEPILNSLSQFEKEKLDKIMALADDELKRNLTLILNYIYDKGMRDKQKEMLNDGYHRHISSLDY